MAGAHQYAAVLCNQRKDVPGAHEIGGAAVVVGKRAHGVGALLRRNTRGEAMATIDRDGKGGAERRIIGGNHWIKMQPLGVLRRNRRAYDSRGIADNEGHLFRRAKRCGDEEIAFIFAIVIIGDDHDLARGKRGEDSLHALVIVKQLRNLPANN